MAERGTMGRGKCSSERSLGALKAPQHPGVQNSMGNEWGMPWECPAGREVIPAALPASQPKPPQICLWDDFCGKREDSTAATPDFAVCCHPPLRRSPRTAQPGWQSPPGISTGRDWQLGITFGVFIPFMTIPNSWFAFLSHCRAQSWHFQSCLCCNSETLFFSSDRRLVGLYLIHKVRSCIFPCTSLCIYLLWILSAILSPISSSHWGFCSPSQLAQRNPCPRKIHIQRESRSKGIHIQGNPDPRESMSKGNPQPKGIHAQRNPCPKGIHVK